MNIYINTGNHDPRNCFGVKLHTKSKFPYMQETIYWMQSRWNSKMRILGLQIPMITLHILILTIQRFWECGENLFKVPNSLSLWQRNCNLLPQTTAKCALPQIFTNTFLLGFQKINLFWEWLKNSNASWLHCELDHLRQTGQNLCKSDHAGNVSSLLPFPAYFLVN